MDKLFRSKFRKTLWVIIAIIIAFATVLGVGLAVNRSGGIFPMSMNTVHKEPHFAGTVTQVYDDAILVSVNEDEDVRRSSDLISVSLNIKLKDSRRTFLVGDKVTVYYNGEIAESYPAQVFTVYAIVLNSPDMGVNMDDLTALFAMQTPYIGDNSAVGKIVDALPRLDREHTQRFFSIGDDYGTGRTPFTLTIYYEPDDTESSDTRNITVTPKNSALLFALIGNLEEVNYAFREMPSNGELDKAAYVSRIAYSRNDITEYLGTIGLGWDDFRNEWKSSVEKLFVLNDGNAQASSIETHENRFPPKSATDVPNDSALYTEIYLVYKDNIPLWSDVVSALTAGGFTYIEDEGTFSAEDPDNQGTYLNGVLTNETGNVRVVDLKYRVLPNDSGEKTMDDAQIFADYFVESLNSGHDLTGDENAMDSWREWFEPRQIQMPLYAGSPREAENMPDVYNFEVTGKASNGDEEGITVTINMQDDETWFYCPYTRYYPHVRPAAEHYLSLIADGDVQKLAGWLSADGDRQNPGSNFIEQAEMAITEYGSFDLSTAKVESVFFSNAEQLFQCHILDSKGGKFPLILKYSDGLVMPVMPQAEVTMTIIEAKSTGISYLLSNSTDKDYTYGEDYTLYVRRNNVWFPVEPIIENWGFNCIGYSLRPQSTTDEISVDWRWLYGQLPDGIYKFQKDYLFSRNPGDYDTFVVAQDFSIP